MKKLLSILISGMVLCSAFPFSVAHAENNEEYVYGGGHYETIDEFNESLDSNLSLNLDEQCSLADLIDDEDEIIANQVIECAYAAEIERVKS